MLTLLHCVPETYAASYSDKVEFRGQNNLTLPADVDDYSLRTFYNKYNVVGSREAFLKNPVGMKGAKGGAFTLELFIHEDRVSTIF